jgi:hypothetical protein
MNRTVWLAIILILAFNQQKTVAQQKIRFPAKDGLEVTDDLTIGIGYTFCFSITPSSVWRRGNT